MDNADLGNDKIQQICEALRKQTLEPAKQQANEIIENAKIEAENIKARAQKEAKDLLSIAQKEIEQKKKLCASSINSASRQVIDKLKQELEQHFFKTNLKDLLDKELAKPTVIAELITAIIHAIEKEGIDSDLAVYVPKQVGVEKINNLLAQDILKKLKEKKVIEKEFSGGAQVKLLDKEITLDVSDEALTDLIANFLRKDFREMIFNA